MTLLGIGLLLLGVAALVGATAYAMDTLRTSRTRTWWEPPADESSALAVGSTTRWSETAPSVSERLRSSLYDPEDPLDGQVWD